MVDDTFKFEPFKLVDGRCPVCDTMVEMKTPGGNLVRLSAHDDPNWCRMAAMILMRSLRSALTSASETRAVDVARAQSFAHRFDVARRMLEHELGKDVTAEINNRVRHDEEMSRLRAEIAIKELGLNKENADG